MLQKSIGAVVLVLFLVGGYFLFTRTSEEDAMETPQQNEEGLKVIASFYPLAYLAQEIGGDYVEVVNLAGSQDVHAYQFTSNDLTQMLRADLVLYQGHSFEPWIKDIEIQLEEGGVRTLSLLESLGVIAEDEHEHADEHEHDHGGVDPHTWLDPVLMQEMATAIADTFSEIDPEHASEYQIRVGSLNERFAQLDAQYASTLQNCTRDTAVFSHDAFGYMAERYGFKVEPIAGLSTLDEPSGNTLVYTWNAIIEKGITAILVEEGEVKRYAETLAEQGDLEILPINPLERGTLDENKDFFVIMEENLSAISRALGCEGAQNETEEM